MGVLTSIAELIAKGFPEKVAQRIASGELPMDEASRLARAQEQGYGPVLYRGHGTEQPPTSDDIWWASDSKEMADSYTSRGVRYDEDLDDFVDVEGTLTPIRTNGNKWFEVDAGGVNHEDLTANVPGHGVLKSTDQIGSVGSYQPGVHGSKITNVVDYYGPDGAPATSYNIRADLPDVNIRHADAAFDPQYTGSNIMGGALAAGVGLGALSQSEDADASEAATEPARQRGYSGGIARAAASNKPETQAPQGAIMGPKYPWMASLAEGLNYGERALEGSVMSAFYPSSLDDAINNFAYHGTMSPGQAAFAALEVGIPSGSGKIGGEALERISTLNRWYQSSDPAAHMKKELGYLFDQGKSFREVSSTPLVQHREQLINEFDYPVLAVDEIPNRPKLQQDFYQGATRLGWADDGLEGAATPVPQGQKPLGILVSGPAASGKSAVANPLARQYNAAIVDPDEAKKMLPGFADGMGANAVHPQSKSMTQQLQDELIRDRYNLVIPTVGSSPDKLLAKADQLRAAGYDVQLLNMDVAAEEAGKRMLLRSAGKGRHIPISVFEKDAQGALDTFGVLRDNRNGAFDGVSQVANGPDVPRKGRKPVLMNSGILTDVLGLTI